MNEPLWKLAQTAMMLGLIVTLVVFVHQSAQIATGSCSGV